MTETKNLASEARAALDAITPGPWEPATAPAHGSDETPAEYVAATLRPDSALLYVVCAPSPDPERWAYVLPAITGDGPTSRANAAFIAAAPDLVRRMAAALDEADAALERAIELSARDMLATIGHAAVAPTVQRLTDALGLDPLPDAAALVGWDELDDEAHAALLNFARARLGLATAPGED